MVGKFYGLGIGPGDSGLVTKKSIDILSSIDYVVTPVAKNNSNSIALDICSDFIGKDVKVEKLLFLMSNDKNKLKEQWIKNAEFIKEKLENGNDVAFITLGDPATYSTYMYMLPYLEDYMEVETIPGITSYASIAAKLNIPLMAGNETLGVMPVVKGCENIRKAIKHFDNLVLMKVCRDKENVVKVLEENNLEGKFVLVSKCTTDDENIIKSISELKEFEVPYLSTMIIKKGGFDE